MPLWRRHGDCNCGGAEKHSKEFEEDLLLNRCIKDIAMIVGLQNVH